MKINNMFLAAAIVLASTQSFAASVCTLSRNYHSCDGKQVAADPIKSLNTTGILQDLANRGYKIVSVNTLSATDVYYTLVKE
ncbi:hypothetical protein [Bdellovibrio sp. HCB288]|uniref:hypothetical protein n=1 Tax=Bdellovibrio sp. HCB288 TaxID=3394355 RepID=UPI0039B66DC7